MIFSEEIQVVVPSYKKTENMRMKVIFDVENMEIFMIIPGRNLNGVTWLDKFLEMEKGKEAVLKLLENSRRIRWSDVFEEKVFDSFNEDFKSEMKLVDTVNWQTSGPPKNWCSSRALIESRKAFGIGKFQIDLLEQQFLKLIPKFRRFLRQSFEKIHNPSYKTFSLEKKSESEVVYEKLFFFILVQFEERTTELEKAKGRLRKLFHVEKCPFEDHVQGMAIYMYYLSDCTPFCEVARKLVHDVNNFPRDVPEDPISVLYLLMFWDLRSEINMGVLLPEPFPSSLVEHIKSLDLSVHHVLEQAELCGSYFDSEFTSTNDEDMFCRDLEMYC